MITTIGQFKRYILEKAVSITDVEHDTCLLIDKKSKEVKLLLINPINSDILGYITATKCTEDFWQIDRSAAEKGYGPLMYDLLLMTFYPKGIKPSQLIKPKALGLWQKYMIERGDVIKLPVDSTSPYYADYYQTEENGSKYTDENVLKVIRTLFYKMPTEEYKKLRQNSEETISKMNINSGVYFKKALDYFWNLYEPALASFDHNNKQLVIYS